MILTYYVCKHLTDSDAYNLRAKTAKELEKMKLEQGWDDYGPTTKVVIHHKNKHELIFRLLGEGGNPETNLPR